MTHPTTLAHLGNQLRQSATARGLGLTRLLKPASPAAGAGFTHLVPGEFWERVLAFTCQLATSAAAGVRQPVLNYQDNDGFTFNQVPLGGFIGPSQTVSFFADQQAVTPVQQPASQVAYGQQTSPAAGTTIATLTLPQGDWLIQWQVMLEANGAVADDDNFGLYVGSALQLQSENGHVAGTDYPQEPAQIPVGAAGATINVKNILIGTATAVYVAQIAAQPITQPGIQSTLPDFVLKSSWQLVVSVAGIQAGDQISVVGMLVEQFPSDVASAIPHPDYGRVLAELAQLARA